KGLAQGSDRYLNPHRGIPPLAPASGGMPLVDEGRRSYQQSATARPPRCLPSRPVLRQTALTARSAAPRILRGTRILRPRRLPCSIIASSSCALSPPARRSPPPPRPWATSPPRSPPSCASTSAPWACG